jgi:hypothetical protein
LHLSLYRFGDRPCRVTYTPDEIRTLQSRDIADGSRLTVDHGNERLDLAGGLTEVEREWLYQRLRDIYGPT